MCACECAQVCVCVCVRARVRACVRLFMHYHCPLWLLILFILVMVRWVSKCLLTQNNWDPLISGCVEIWTFYQLFNCYCYLSKNVSIWVGLVCIRCLRVRNLYVIETMALLKSQLLKDISAFQLCVCRVWFTDRLCVLTRLFVYTVLAVCVYYGQSVSIT